jgi:uncharacterized protein (TIGR00255 family)
MVRSMTGFGRREVTDDHYAVTVELKSVNHRFLDVSVRLPRQFSALEEPIRKVVSARLTRGHIDAHLAVRTVGLMPRAVQVDIDLAAGYVSAISRMAESLGLPAEPARILELLTRLPDVLKAEEAADDLGELSALAAAAAAGAADELVAMRETEGQALVSDLLQRLDVVDVCVAAVEARSPGVVDDYRQRLTDRIAELVGEPQVDSGRLALEIAMFADKASIAEETVRLSSHMAQFRDTLAGDGPVGRRLDFLTQEMFREVNTIGSKANDIEIASQVVVAKTELEKIREQVQNIE